MSEEYVDKATQNKHVNKSYQTSLTTIGEILSSNDLVQPSRNYPDIDNGSVAISKEWTEHPHHNEVIQILVASYGTSDVEKSEYAKKLDDLNFWDNRLGKHIRQTFSLLRKILVPQSYIQEIREELGWHSEIRFSYKNEIIAIKKHLKINLDDPSELFNELYLSLTSTNLPTSEVFSQIKQSLKNHNYTISQAYEDKTWFYSSFVQALRTGLLGKELAQEINQKRSSPVDIIRYNIRKQENLIKDMLYDEYNEDFFTESDIEELLGDIERSSSIYTLEVKKRIEKAKRLIDEETQEKLAFLEANGKSFLIPLPFHIEDKDRENKNYSLYYYRKSFIQFYKELLSESINNLVNDKEVALVASHIVEKMKDEFQEEIWTQRLEDFSEPFENFIKNRYKKDDHNEEIVRMIRVYDKEYKVIKKERCIQIAKEFVEYKEAIEKLDSEETHYSAEKIMAKMNTRIVDFLSNTSEIDDIYEGLLNRLNRITWSKFKSNLNSRSDLVLSLKSNSANEISTNFYQIEFVDNWMSEIELYLDSVVEREINSLKNSLEG
jgi:hypothetical protein